MVMKLAPGLGAIVVVLIAVIAMQPSWFTVERSAAIEAPVDIVCGHIEGLRAMHAGLPWVGG